MDWPDSEEDREPRVGFRMRCVVYFGVWLLAIIAMEFWVEPEGGTVTDLSPLQQRLRWPVQAPLMIAMGLAGALSWPEVPNGNQFLGAAAVLIVHGAYALRSAPQSLVMALAMVQLALVTVGIVYFNRLAELPTGG